MNLDGEQRRLRGGAVVIPAASPAGRREVCNDGSGSLIVMLRLAITLSDRGLYDLAAKLHEHIAEKARAA